MKKDKLVKEHKALKLFNKGELIQREVFVQNSFGYIGSEWKEIDNKLSLLQAISEGARFRRVTHN
jgi:hypothetical protein|tara:strand:- start:50 stop:244 length:195 start_codon:yes stop_codon:yes gene_type:complete